MRSAHGFEIRLGLENPSETGAQRHTYDAPNILFPEILSQIRRLGGTGEKINSMVKRPGLFTRGA